MQYLVVSLIKVNYDFYFICVRKTRKKNHNDHTWLSLWPRKSGSSISAWTSREAIFAGTTGGPRKAYCLFVLNNGSAVLNHKLFTSISSNMRYLEFHWGLGCQVDHRDRGRQGNHLYREHLKYAKE